MSEAVGFIGVGLMGHGMAKNIVEKGYKLTILGHRNRAPVEDLVKRGATEAKSAREVAAASSIVFLCVTGAAEVEGNVRGPDGLAAGAKKGLIIVDCSTTDPTSTIALADELKPQGVTLIDAPLGGTPAQAEEGKLSAMVGADAESYARVKPVIEAWAQSVRHIGPVGDGHKMKLLNNFLAMGYGAIYSEALAVAQKSGISAETFDSVIRGSRMDCGFYQTFFKYVLEGDRNAHQFTLKNALKDVRYLEAMANKAGVANPVGNAVKNTYAAAVNAGRDQDFVPMLSDFVASANGVKTKA
ncbi:NAD(P)-dependent oxidoreductase [Terrarubrum flagellatum]|uniref:NAD(P)-dependent oxidoreductase n=1 Tax=Terrirubrum flagellatum TaxID=2895980 RepID=UPI003144D61C